MHPIRTLLSAVLCASVALFQPTTWAAPIKLVITTDLPAQTAALAFDLVDGGAPSNSVTVADFTTTGLLDGATISGSVFGLLPGSVQLSDVSFFSEYLQSLTLGTVTSFALSNTGNAPVTGSFPDSFSFFLLDSSGQSLVTTTDPTGANALFLLNIGFDDPIIFQGASFLVQVEAIPESNTGYMILAGLICIALLTKRRKDAAQ